MKTTIDAAGRLVVPKPMREELGFGPDQVVELTAIEGRLEVTVPSTPMHLEERAGVLIGVADQEEPLPPLTDEMVRETLERVRR